METPQIKLKCATVENSVNGSNNAKPIAETEKQSFSFRCTSCGKCCEGEGIVYFTSEDLQAIKEYLGLSEKKMSQLKKKLIQEKSKGLYLHNNSSACILLGPDRKCSVYPVRPLQCRTYPFWPSNFATQAGFKSLQQSCPGSKKTSTKVNSTYSVLSITRKVNKTALEFLNLQNGSKDPFQL